MHLSLSEQKKVRFELAWKYKARPGDIQESSASTVYFKVQYYTTWGERLANRFKDREIDQ